MIRIREETDGWPWTWFHNLSTTALIMNQTRQVLYQLAPVLCIMCIININIMYIINTHTHTYILHVYVCLVSLHILIYTCFVFLWCNCIGFGFVYTISLLFYFLLYTISFTGVTIFNHSIWRHLNVVQQQKDKESIPKQSNQKNKVTIEHARTHTFTRVHIRVHNIRT